MSTARLISVCLAVNTVNLVKQALTNVWNALRALFSRMVVVAARTEATLIQKHHSVLPVTILVLHALRLASVRLALMASL